MKNLLLIAAFLFSEAAFCLPTTHGTISITHAIQSKMWLFNTSSGTLGYVSTGYTLPTGSYILRSKLQVYTAFSPATTAGTISVGCGTTGAVIKALGTIGQAAGTFLDGVSDGTAALVQAATLGCDITARIVNQAQTSGLLKGWIEYIVP